MPTPPLTDAQLQDAINLAGVYEIVNISNGRRYIGSAVNFKRRWKDHVRALKRGAHHSKYLQRAWSKYGSSAFRFRLIRSCDQCDLIPIEQYYIDGFNPAYNASPTAGSNKGCKWPHRRRASSFSEEHRANLAKAARGQVFTPERCANISAAKKGMTFSPEHKAKISAGHRGKKLSPEHREKLSVAMLRFRERQRNAN